VAPYGPTVPEYIEEFHRHAMKVADRDLSRRWAGQPGAIVAAYDHPFVDLASDNQPYLGRTGGPDGLLFELTRLVEDVRVPVDVFPGTGTNLTTSRPSL
jgi:hypothetical protein